MTNGKRWIVVSSLGAVLLLTVFSQECEAFWLRNLFSRCRSYRAQPVTTYRPISCCQPTCQPVSCQRTVVQYVPRVAYRTNWTRRPVTVYRPVTATDPCTSCPVVSYRPCTTYQWQAQRVPYTAYQAVASVVPASPCCSTTVAAPVMQATVPIGQYAAPSTNYSNCAPAATVVPAQIPQVRIAPSPQPVHVQPGIGPPSQIQPNVPLNQPPAATDPASRSPRLELAPQPDNQGSTSRFQSSYREPAPNQDRGLQPIRSLDVEDHDDAPHLIDPRDRTASFGSIRLVSGISEIKWADSSTTVDSSVQLKSDSVKWDDSGWESAGP